MNVPLQIITLTSTAESVPVLESLDLDIVRTPNTYEAYADVLDDRRLYFRVVL